MVVLLNGFWKKKKKKSFTLYSIYVFIQDTEDNFKQLLIKFADGTKASGIEDHKEGKPLSHSCRSIQIAWQARVILMQPVVKTYMYSQRVKGIFTGWGTVLYKMEMIKRIPRVKARSMGDNQLNKSSQYDAVLR